MIKIALRGCVCSVCGMHSEVDIDNHVGDFVKDLPDVLRVGGTREMGVERLPRTPIERFELFPNVCRSFVGSVGI